MASRNENELRIAESDAATGHEDGLARLLKAYSVEVTARDVDAVIGAIPAGVEIFLANLPNDGLDVLVQGASRLRKAGLVPVPHIVARKLHDFNELDVLLARLREEADVDRVLSLGGDRDRPMGAFAESLALIESGAFEKHGIRHVSIACYPEGHPRIAEAPLRRALGAKLAAAAGRGLETRLVSQFAFEPGPIIEFARGLRADGVTAPLRVGVAGPASTTKLIKYAMRCGVGASLRTLTKRKGIAGSLLGGETPEAVLKAIAAAVAADPSLGIGGVHFFTFGAPAKSVEWAEQHLG